MRRVPLSEVGPGDVLAQPVYNDRGDLLLQVGVALTDGYIERLRKRGVLSVLVHDPSLGEAPPPVDIISDRVRQTAVSTVSRVFELAARATQDLQGRSTAQITAALDSSSRRGGIFGPGFYAQLYRTVESILVEVINADTISGLTSLKTHDNYTFCHSIDVTVTALLLGKKLFLPRDALRELGVGCLLHDVGKVLVETAILNKAGQLSPDELAQIRQHPVFGYELLRRQPPSLLGRPAVLARHVVWQHHERQDGTGYPRGLTGANRVWRSEKERHDSQRIILLAELAAVADVYDALTSDRPYRPGLPAEKIVGILRDLHGQHLNAEIVDAFLTVLPVYPQGMDVAVTAGPYRDFRGAVVAVNRRAPDRPRIRLFRDRSGRRIAPVDVDLVDSAATEITCAMPEPVLV